MSQQEKALRRFEKEKRESLHHTNVEVIVAQCSEVTPQEIFCALRSVAFSAGAWFGADGGNAAKDKWYRLEDELRRRLGVPSSGMVSS